MIDETQNFTDKERILPHVNAAVFLLQNRLSYAISNPSLRGLLLEMFCYFFSLAAFSLGPKLTLSRASPIFNSPSVIWLIQHGHILGTTQHLFITIYRISLLTQNLVSQDPEVASAVRSELQLYDQHLDSLQPNPNPDQNIEAGCLHDTVTSELYRIACQIHVKRLLAQDTPDEDDIIQQLVISFINLLHQLPDNSPYQNILSWPLVVAGYSAPTKGYQDLISARLDQIQSEWRSDVFSKSAVFLRLKWRTDRGSACASSGSVTSRCTRALAAQDYISAWNSCPVIMA
ncbi:hypothetical protein N7488_002356 [Penicillium malachiteum]|nr:hypothetical protein N7488_002356 [Penicillium malachiteum]